MVISRTAEFAHGQKPHGTEKMGGSIERRKNEMKEYADKYNYGDYLEWQTKLIAGETLYH